MKKTKEQKIKAAVRRQQFLYNLGSLKIKEEALTKEESPKVVSAATPKETPATLVQNYSYVKRDILKIAIFSTIAIVVQIVLYLTLF